MIPQVAAGIEWLNDTDPEWVEKIDLERFEFYNGQYCVAGQVFADIASSDETCWYNGYDVLIGTFGLQWVINHGFSGARDIYTEWVDWLEEQKGVAA